MLGFYLAAKKKKKKDKINELDSMKKIDNFLKVLLRTVISAFLQLIYVMHMLKILFNKIILSYYCNNFVY